MKKILLSILLLAISVTTVNADETDYRLPQTVTGGYYPNGGWSNIANLANDADGGAFAETHVTLSGYHSYRTLGFDFNDLGTNKITRIDVELRARRRFNVTPTTSFAFWVVQPDGDVSTALNPPETFFQGNINSTSFTTYNFHVKDIPGFERVSEYFQNAGGVNDVKLVMDLSGNSGSGSSNFIEVDYIKVKFTYENANPYSYITDVTASPSAQLNLIDLQGDTATSSANMTCKVSVFEKCVKTGYASGWSTSPVANIYLNDNGNTSTVWRGGTEYEGYGWSASDSTWQADDIRIPYEPGTTCEYKHAVTCYERELVCNEEEPPICVWGDTIIHSQLTDLGDPTTIENAVEYTEPEPDNPLAWIVWKTKQMLFDLFVPNFSLSLLEIESIKQNLYSRAPFAYILPIFDIDYSEPNGSETAPTINFPSAYATGSDYAWSAPAWLYTVLSSMKGLFTVILWLGFIVYLFNLSKRVLPQ